MAVTWRCKISLLVLKKYFTSQLHSLMNDIEEKFCISTRHGCIKYPLFVLHKHLKIKALLYGFYRNYK